MGNALEGIITQQHADSSDIHDDYDLNHGLELELNSSNNKNNDDVDPENDRDHNNVVHNNKNENDDNHDTVHQKNDRNNRYDDGFYESLLEDDLDSENLDNVEGTKAEPSRQEDVESGTGAELEPPTATELKEGSQVNTGLWTLQRDRPYRRIAVKYNGMSPEDIFARPKLNAYGPAFLERDALKDRQTIINAYYQVRQSMILLYNVNRDLMDYWQYLESFEHQSECPGDGTKHEIRIPMSYIGTGPITNTIRSIMASMKLSNSLRKSLADALNRV
ncbi:hypothetical protein BGZ67_000420 [Mortierella alpina]|nr:hypothetical protein BGZ67_000420 [Mortierella alpina]